MEQDPPHWQSFRDLTDPDEAARLLTEWYGAAAAGAAAECAAAARTDHRHADHRFWIAVAASISNADQETRKTGGD